MSELETNIRTLQKVKEYQVCVEDKTFSVDIPRITISYLNSSREIDYFDLLYMFNTPIVKYPCVLMDDGMTVDENTLIIIRGLCDILQNLLDMTFIRPDFNPDILVMYNWDYTPQAYREIQWIESIGLPMWYGLSDLKDGLQYASELYSNRAGYVYLLQAITPFEHYKIGRSKTPVTRIDSLGVKLPFPIEPLHIIRTNDMYTLEKYYHQRFADKCINGEWFCLTHADVTELCSHPFVYTENLK
jgi:Meiotically up-regulated gene 113